MRSLHFIIVKKMSHAVCTIERAAYDMIEAEARFSVFNDIFNILRQIFWGRSKGGLRITNIWFKRHFLFSNNLFEAVVTRDTIQ
ncbi:hypothetical protein ROS217_07889 [Roseovarius sp. 217]|nr:hypothetical protein ROS217_07889 [Roseovarius sp. 217]